MAKKKAKRWTEGLVFEALRHVWPSPAHVRLPQVRNGTGFSRAKTRTADAVIASTWPSRGLWLAGVEIKVTVQDWKLELSRPEKADAIGKYCDFWYVAAPAGVVPIEQVPETWGLVEVSGNTARIVKSAERRAEVMPLDMSLMCSILRTAEKVMVPAEEASRRVEEAVAADEDEKRQARKDSRELSELRAKVQSFELASGVSISDRWCLGDVGKAVKVIQDAGSPERALDELRTRASVVTHVAERINKALAECAAEEGEG